MTKPTRRKKEEIFWAPSDEGTGRLLIGGKEPLTVKIENLTIKIEHTGVLAAAIIFFLGAFIIVVNI